ncbi:unnamed protein product [Closterium sp. NIES-53]
MSNALRATLISVRCRTPDIMDESNLLTPHPPIPPFPLRPSSPPPSPPPPPPPFTQVPSPDIQYCIPPLVFLLFLPGRPISAPSPALHSKSTPDWIET